MHCGYRERKLLSAEELNTQLRRVGYNGGCCTPIGSKCGIIGVSSFNMSILTFKMEDMYTTHRH